MSFEGVECEGVSLQKGLGGVDEARLSTYHTVRISEAPSPPVSSCVFHRDEEIERAEINGILWGVEQS